ncbi:MAG TPA: spore germination protein GerW family protein [Terriglobales bacterium]|jgi:uncharacterized spore protein YtfJ
MGSLNLLQSLHENLSGRAQVKSVFGEPIIAADKTVIPVARVAYGFGAGAGTGGVGDKSAKGEGGGGGGGMRATPIGIFVVGPQESRFVPIHNQRKMVGVLLVGAFLGMIFSRRRR